MFGLDSTVKGGNVEITKMNVLIGLAGLCWWVSSSWGDEKLRCMTAPERRLLQFDEYLFGEFFQALGVFRAHAEQQLFHRGALFKFSGTEFIGD